MDFNIFKYLDEDTEVPRSLQQRMKGLEVEKSGIEKDEGTVKSKAITGKKNKLKRLSKQQQFKAEARLEKKKKRKLLVAKSKSTY